MHEAVSNRLPFLITEIFLFLLMMLLGEEYWGGDLGFWEGEKKRFFSPRFFIGCGIFSAIFFQLQS